MKTQAEAEQELARDPMNVADDTRAAVVAVHGEEGFKKLRHEAMSKQAANIRVSSNNTGWFVPGAPRSASSAPAAHHDPQDPHDPRNGGDSQWERTIAGAEQELTTNPVYMSSASKALLRTRWGEAEFKRRYQHALNASGALDMKVKIK